MANSPPMPPPPPHTPRDPPPPPSYLASIAQKKANDHASAKSNAVHAVGGHVPLIPVPLQVMHVVLDVEPVPVT